MRTNQHRFDATRLLLTRVLGIVTAALVASCTASFDEPAASGTDEAALISALEATSPDSESDDAFAAGLASEEASTADVGIQAEGCDCLQRFNDCFGIGDGWDLELFCLGALEGCCSRCGGEGQGCL